MMLKFAGIASALVLVIAQPAMAAAMQSAPSNVTATGQSASEHRANLTPGTIAISLAALTAVALGVVAATSDGGHKHHPTSP